MKLDWPTWQLVAELVGEFPLEFEGAGHLDQVHCLETQQAATVCVSVCYMYMCIYCY